MLLPGGAGPDVAAAVGLVARGRDEGRVLAAGHGERPDGERLGERHPHQVFALGRPLGLAGRRAHGEAAGRDDDHLRAVGTVPEALAGARHEAARPAGAEVDPDALAWLLRRRRRGRRQAHGEGDDGDGYAAPRQRRRRERRSSFVHSVRPGIIASNPGALSLRFRQRLDRHVAQPFPIASDDGPAAPSNSTTRSSVPGDSSRLPVRRRLVAPARAPAGSAHASASWESRRPASSSTGLPDADGKVVARQPADRPLLLAEQLLGDRGHAPVDVIGESRATRTLSSPLPSLLCRASSSA